MIAVIAILAIISYARSETIHTYQLPLKETTVERPSQQVYSTEYLKSYVGEVSIKYGLSAEKYQQIMATIQCESNWNVLADNGISFGIAQFTPATWKDFGSGDIMNPLTQLEVMARMFSQHLEHRWDCAKILGFIK